MLTGMALTVFAAGAAWQDLRKDKILNKYVMAGCLTGLLLRAATGGAPVLGWQILSVAAALAIGFPFYLISALGAGDVKCLAAAAAYVPFSEWMQLAAFALVIAAVYGLGKLIVKRTIHGRIHFAVPVLMSAVLLQGVTFV